MRITASGGQAFTDIVTCGRCGGAGTDLSLTRCPADGAVLGERSVTDAELAEIRPFGAAFTITRWKSS